MEVFTQDVSVRWSDLDPNGHVRHSAFYDYGAAARVAFLQKHGFGIEWMMKNGVGPVLFREEAKFMRELHMSDEITINVLITGLSEDHRKWNMRHEIRRGDELCCVLDMDGAWMDTRARKIAPPPQDLVETFESLPRSEDFQMILPRKK
ncbi:MAG: thioesterase family protein [Gammaproteobacteria bacterium]|nr:thioesterase family protein [Gammaproteobacteria bacterium]